MGIFNWGRSSNGEPHSSGRKAGKIAETPLKDNFIELRENDPSHLAEVLSRKHVTAILFYKRYCLACMEAVSALKELAGVCKSVVFCTHRTSSSGLFAKKFGISGIPLLVLFIWDSPQNCPRAVSYTLEFGAKDYIRERYTGRIENVLTGKYAKMTLKLHEFEDPKNFKIIMPAPKLLYYL